MSITQVITTLPTAPDPATQTPTVFSTTAAASVLAQKAMVPELNTFATQANELAAAMNLNSTNDTSTSSVLIGTGAKTFTVSSGKSFQGGMYLVIADTAAPSTNSMHGQVTSYSGTTLISNILSVVGSGTKTAWTISQSAPAGSSSSHTVVRSARTANTILDVSDRGTLVDITSGTFSQTFTAAATLGSGWWCYLKNSGTGVITLDPDAAETIDSLATYAMYTGETRLIQCTGTAFTTVVLSPFYASFTTGVNTFTKPPGYSYFEGLLWGAGGSGGKSSGANFGAGGGGGACVPFKVKASAVGTTETVTIAAGGAAQTSVDTTGNVGNNTTFGSLFTAYGGGGGGGANAANESGGGGGGALGAGSAGTGTGVRTGGEPNQSDSTGAVVCGGGLGGGWGSVGGGTTGNSSWGGAGGGGITNAGGASVYGGGGGGGGSAGSGGASKFGGAGGAGSAAGTATTGTQPGGGGGGTGTGTSGAGGAGECHIWGLA